MRITFADKQFFSAPNPPRGSVDPSDPIVPRTELITSRDVLINSTIRTTSRSRHKAVKAGQLITPSGINFRLPEADNAGFEWTRLRSVVIGALCLRVTRMFDGEAEMDPLFGRVCFDRRQARNQKFCHQRCKINDRNFFKRFSSQGLNGKKWYPFV